MQWIALSLCFVHRAEDGSIPLAPTPTSSPQLSRATLLGTPEPENPQQRHPQLREDLHRPLSRPNPATVCQHPAPTPTSPRNNRGRRCWAPQNPKTPNNVTLNRGSTFTGRDLDQTPPRFANTPRQPQQAPATIEGDVIGHPRTREPPTTSPSTAGGSAGRPSPGDRTDRATGATPAMHSQKRPGRRVPGRRGPRPAPPASPARPAPSEQRPRCHP